MPSTTRRSTSVRERRRGVEARVFDAVERLLAGGASYTDLGIGRIADEAGIGRSTFYLHFADKTELLLRLTRTATAELFAVADDWVGGSDAGLGPLTSAMAAIVGHRRAHAHALQALDEVSSYDEEVAAFWADLVDGFATRLQQRLEREQADGVVDAALDAEATARILVWSVERSVARHVADPHGIDDERLAAALARSVRGAIYG